MTFLVSLVRYAISSLDWMYSCSSAHASPAEEQGQQAGCQTGRSKPAWRQELRTHEHRVGVGCRDGDEHPAREVGQERDGLGADEGRDDLAVEVGDVQAEERAEHEERRVEHEQAGLLGRPRRDHDPQELG